MTATTPWQAIAPTTPPPSGLRDGNSRVTCIDHTEFDAGGFTQPIRITREDVPAPPATSKRFGFAA